MTPLPCGRSKPFRLMLIIELLEQSIIGIFPELWKQPQQKNGAHTNNMADPCVYVCSVGRTTAVWRVSVCVCGAVVCIYGVESERWDDD